MTPKAAATQIVKTLRQKGFTALLAGGCVRDMLLGRIAKDYDVATNAQPEDIVKIFPRTLTVGAKFGVVIVLINRCQVEVATFRTESGYIDGRHPSIIEFADAREDASRRDFTINGMFYDPIENKVIDFVDGRADLDRRLIRTIGSPLERFSEDYLRMLRAVRFSAQLGFDIETATFDAVRTLASRTTKISGERIAMELEAILISPARAAGCRMLFETGLLKAVFPTLKNTSALAGIETLARLRKNVTFALALAALWYHAPAETALAQLEILKPSTGQKKHFAYLLKNRGALLDTAMPVSTLKRFAANPYFRDLFELHKAILRATGASVYPLTKLKQRLRSLKGVELAPKPLLNGHDLIALGAITGPQVGALAEELYIQQLEGSLTTPEQARKYARDWLASRK